MILNFFGLALLFGCASLFVEGGLFGRKTLKEEGGRGGADSHKGEDGSATLSGVVKGLQKQYGAFRDLLESGDPELLKSAKKRIEAKLNDFRVLLKDTEEGGRYVGDSHKGEDHSAILSGVEKHVQQRYAAFIDLLKSGDQELIKSAKKRIGAKLNDFMVLLKDTESKQTASRSHPQGPGGPT